MTRRPTFWIVFGALGVAGVVTAVRLFSVALPNVSVDVTMDRGEAIQEAAELSARYGWGPPDDRSAASFGQVDPEVQTYVELEGGGVDAFSELSARNVYQPYQWRVRRFAERRVDESVVRFTPAGTAYGFNLRLAEDDPGRGNLDEAAARSVAEATAAEWDVDLASFELAEASQDAHGRPGRSHARVRAVGRSRGRSSLPPPHQGGRRPACRADPFRSGPTVVLASVR